MGVQLEKIEGETVGLEGPSGGVAALDRGIAILTAFTTSDPALTLAELASRTGIYKSTILRLAQSLIHAGLLIRLHDGRYRIGPLALRLGTLYQAGLNLGDILTPLMRELMEATGESSIFYVREGDRRVCLYRVEPPASLRYNIAIGDEVQMDRGSGARVLLAFSGIAGKPYDTIRREYHFVARGERDPDIAGMSVPVFGAGQTLIGSLALAGPISRIDAAKETMMVPLLMAAGALATRDLGGDPHPILAAKDVFEASLLTKKLKSTASQNQFPATR